jgi:hypothetical protein
MAVNVDWDAVEDVESLDKIFKKAIAKADEADEAEIRTQWSESKAQFWERKAQTAALDVARRNALDKYPLAKEFAEDIRGTSPAEIEAQAKRFHERMEKVTKDAEDAKAAAQKAEEDARAQALQQYGRPAGAGAGSPTPPATDPLSKEAAIQRVHAKLQRGEGMQRGADKMDVITMANERLRQAIDFQREPHPDLGIGVGGSYRREPAGNPVGQPVVNALVEGRRQKK